jgi:hypothetical protein
VPVVRARAAWGCALLVNAVSGACGLTVGVARAQARSVPMGGRTATMGGTGVAEGNDIAAPLVNPAGIAAVDGQVFGLSSSLYSYNSASVSNFFAPNGFSPAFGQVNVDTQSFSSSNLTAVPSGVGFFRHIGPGRANEPGHLVIGLAALSPVDYSNQADARLHATLDSTNGFIDRQTGLTERALDLYVGPVAGIVLSPHLRAGLSLLGLYRNRYLLATTTMTQSEQGGNDFASYRGSWLDEGSSYGAIAIAGVQYEAFPNFWAGVSVQSPSVQFEGTEHQTRAETLFLNAPPVTAPTNVINQGTADLRYREIEPPRLSLGLAYDRPQAFTLAADITYVVPYPGIDNASGTTQTAETTSGSATRNVVASYDRTVDGLSRVDFSVGAEVYVTPNIAIRGGFSEAFDPRAVPALGANTVFTTRRNLTTATAGVGLVVGPFDTTLGAAWQHASGSIDVEDLFGTAPSASANYPGYARLDLTENTFMLLLSGNVTEKEAIEQIEGRLKEVGGMAEAIKALSECPKTLDAAAIDGFDYTTAFPRHEEDAKSIKASLIVLAKMKAFAERVEAQLTSGCEDLAHALGSTEHFANPRDACGDVVAAIGNVRDRLGVARWRVDASPAECTVSTQAVTECLTNCSESAAKNAASVCSANVERCKVQDLDVGGAASCAGSCELRALENVDCKDPVALASLGASALPEIATLAQRLPTLLHLLGSLPNDASIVVARARELVAGATAAMRLAGDGGPEALAEVTACVGVPAASALPGLKDLAESLRSAAAVVAKAAQSTP